MQQYCDLILDILNDGVDKNDRTGVGSRYIWGAQFHMDLAEGFPAVTVRPVPLRWAFEETMFFLRGETQTKKLEEKGITIWKGNTSREFLDGRGDPLKYYPEGHMGKGYGHQWRNFGGLSDVERVVRDGSGDYFPPDGVDQINILVDRMISNPDCRRHIVSAWNPAQLHEMALPPCHILQHYDINDGKLNSLFWMRSNDVPYGLPFNIVQYAFLNLMFAKLLNLEPGMLVYQCSNSHIYQNQLWMAQTIAEREPTPLPTVEITKDLNTLDDVLTLEWEDIEVTGYNPHPDVKDKPPMAV